jgi:uncharacterized protein (DUF1800 family)
MPIPAFTDPFQKKHLLHLLRRTLFGFNLADLKKFEGKSLVETIDILCVLGANPAPPLNTVEATDPDVAIGQTWVNAHPTTDQLTQYRRESFEVWLLNKIIFQETNIAEKMNFFWYHHIPAEANFNQTHQQYQYIQLLRTHSLGNFKTLVTEISTHPCMLNYLSGKENTSKAPNENFARELLELFTIGKDNPSNTYNESDVQQASKALTGWRVDNTKNTPSTFDLSKHDLGPKSFSAFFGSQIIKNTVDADMGKNDLKSLIDMIFTKDDVALYVVRKLYRYFVYYDISPEIEAKIITPLAQTFRTQNYEILPVIKELLGSQHFMSDSVIGAMIRNPIEYALTPMKLLGMNWSSTPKEIFDFTRSLHYKLSDQGMNLEYPPSVAGWPAYYQSPSFHEIWITSANLRSRKDITDALINKYWKNCSYSLLSFTSQLTHVDDVDLMIDEVIELLHPLPSELTLKNTLKNILISPQTDSYYWNQIWNDYTTNPTDATKVKTVESRLKTFYSTLLGMAESHLE